MLSRLKNYCLLLALFLCAGTSGAVPDFDDWTVVSPACPGTACVGVTPGMPTTDSDGLSGGFVQQQVTNGPGVTDDDPTYGGACSRVTFAYGTSELINSIGEPVDFIGGRAYIPNGPDGTVSVVDTTTYQVVTTIPVGMFPYGVAIDPRGLRVYISNRGSNSVSIIDTDTLDVTDTIQTGAMPAGITMDRQGRRLFIALEGESAISVVDTSLLAEIKRIPLSNSPHDFVISPVKPVAYVLSRTSAVISVIDLNTLEVTAIIPLAIDSYTQPTAIAVSPDGDRIYTTLLTPDRTSSVLTVTDAATRQVSYVATFARPIIDITQNADGSSLFLVPYVEDACTDVQEVDTNSYAVVKTYMTAGGLARASYDQQSFHVISRDSNVFRTYLIADGGTEVSLLGATGNQPMALGDFMGPMRAPVATPDAMSIDFGSVNLNHSAVRTLTVTNTGNFPLKIYQARIEDPIVGCSSGPCDIHVDSSSIFSVPEDNCTGNIIAIDASCTIIVRFAPVAADVLPGGTLRLHTNSDYWGVGISLGGTVTTPASVSTSPNEDVITPTADKDARQDGGGGALDPVELFLIGFSSLIVSNYRRRSLGAKCIRPLSPR
jgi:YVTN family beta-propeller protein